MSLSSRSSTRRTLHLAPGLACLAALAGLGIAAAPAAAALPLLPGEVVVTCRSVEGLPPSPYVVAILDLRDPGCDPTAVPGQQWPRVGYHNEMPNPTGDPADEWTAANLGQVFGIAIDDDDPPSIYVASSSAYTAVAASGRIFRLDGATGAISLFGLLPNTGSGIGNLAFDHGHGQFFVTNHEDGRIYRLDRAGITIEALDPFLPDDGAPGFAPLGERLWAVGVYRSRVYFSVWREDQLRKDPDRATEVWSVGLDPGGAFVAEDLVLEVTLPPVPASSPEYSNPVADIAFSPDGKMMLAERTMRGDNIASAHDSRLLQYVGEHLAWAPSGASYVLGEFGQLRNASGGVTYDCAEDDACNTGPHVWATGDYLLLNPRTYGLQGLPAAGGDLTNSYVVDLGAPKTYLGDVEAYAACPPTPCAAPPSAVASAPATACAGETVRLDGQASAGCGGRLEYRWLEGGTPRCDWSGSPDCLTLALGPTAYTLETRCADEPECLAAATVPVEVFPVPTASLATPPPTCAGVLVTLDATASAGNGCPALEYRFLSAATVVRSWDASPAFGPFVPAASASYTVEVRCGACTDSASSEVTVLAQAEAAAGPDGAVCRFDTLTLTGSGSSTPGCAGGLLYEWREGASVVRTADPDPSFAPATDSIGTRRYTLWVWCAGAPECAASDEATVTVNPCTLAVVFAAYQAAWRSGRIEVSWTTALEAGTLGFVVERASRASGPFAAVARVPAHGAHQPYRASDDPGTVDSAPWYRVVELTADGRGDRTPAFQPSGMGERKPASGERRRQSRRSR